MPPRALAKPLALGLLLLATARGAAADPSAADLADAIKARIPAIVITLQGVPAGVEATVIVDGELVPAASLAAPRKVDPGSHHVVAKIGSGLESATDVTVKEGETKPATLTVTAPEGTTTTPPTTTATTSASTMPVGPNEATATLVVGPGSVGVAGAF